MVPEPWFEGTRIRRSQTGAQAPGLFPACTSGVRPESGKETILLSVFRPKSVPPASFRPRSLACGPGSGALRLLSSRGHGGCNRP